MDVKKYFEYAVVFVVWTLYFAGMGFFGLAYTTKQECTEICATNKMHYNSLDIKYDSFWVAKRKCVCRNNNQGGIEFDIDWYNEFKKTQESIGEK